MEKNEDSTTTMVHVGITTQLASLPRGSHLDVNALAAILGRCKVSVQRAVRRGELPAPFKLMGKSTWTTDAIISHLHERQAKSLATTNRRNEKRT